MFLQHDLMVQTEARVLRSVLLSTWEQTRFLQLWKEKAFFKQKAVFTLRRCIIRSQRTRRGAQWYVAWDSVSVCLHTSTSFIHAFMENHTPLVCILHVWAFALECNDPGAYYNCSKLQSTFRASASTSSSSSSSSSRSLAQTSPTNCLVDENMAFPFQLLKTKSVREAKLDKIVSEQLDHSSLELMPSAPVTFLFCFFLFVCFFLAS